MEFNFLNVIMNKNMKLSNAFNSTGSQWNKVMEFCSQNLLHFTIKRVVIDHWCL